MPAEPARPLVPRPVAGSLDELLAGVQRRQPFRPLDERSGSNFERVWIDDEALVVKYLHLDDDFPMRVSGDIGCRSLRAYAAGLYDVAPTSSITASSGWPRASVATGGARRS